MAAMACISCLCIQITSLLAVTLQTMASARVHLSQAGQNGAVWVCLRATAGIRLNITDWGVEEFPVPGY